MSLVDRTNEEIALSLHEPLQGSNPVGDYFHEPTLYVDADFDSSFEPSDWVGIHLTDSEHDSDRIKLTYEEAGLLHDRLGLILGRDSEAALSRISGRLLAALPTTRVGVRPVHDAVMSILIEETK